MGNRIYFVIEVIIGLITQSLFYLSRRLDFFS